MRWVKDGVGVRLEGRGKSAAPIETWLEEEEESTISCGVIWLGYHEKVRNTQDRRK